MKITISQKTYNKEHEKKKTPTNERKRPAKQHFFDAILSVDEKSVPDWDQTKKIFKNL